MRFDTTHGSGGGTMDMSEMITPGPFSDAYRNSLSQQVHALVSILGTHLESYGPNPTRSRLLQMRSVCIRLRTLSKILTNLSESGYADLLQRRPHLDVEVTRLREQFGDYARALTALDAYLEKACKIPAGPSDRLLQPFVMVYGKFLMEHWSQFRNAWCEIWIDAFSQDTGTCD